MDDTLWITHSIEQLELITQTASTFYKMAHIKVNPQKSVLTSNLSSPFTINFIDTTIQSQSKNTLFKFLGCWFTAALHYPTQINLIKQEALDLIQTLDTKKITDKQTCYIINNVIIPILEYRIHNIVIPRNICNSLLSKYLSVAKHKAHLARSTPTSTLLNHNIYGIKNIWDIQLQHHIPNLLLRLNNPNLLGKSTHIRLQQLQNNLWSTTNILQHPNPRIDGPNKNTTTFKIILLINQLQSSISSHQNTLQPYTLQHPYTPLENILKTHPQYINFKKQLCNKKIIYLEQLTSYDNRTLLQWSHISPHIDYLPTGRKPL